MNLWAIIKTGGKQYKVQVGDTIAVDKIEGDKANTIFKDVLAVNKDGNLTIGKPKLEKSQVKAKILGSLKEKKVRVVKFKSKSRYLRVSGHRQKKTKVLIEKIES